MPAPQEILMQFFAGSWITQGIAVAAELDIADRLTRGPATASDLAKQCGADADSLYRLLRALAGVGIFTEEEQGRFSLTPTAELLRSDVKGSQRGYAIMMGAELHRAWGELLHSVRTGERGFDKAFGKPNFVYMQEHPDRHAIYDQAMAGYGIAETEAMLAVYDFSGFGEVADVGGGNGQMLTAVLKRHPSLKGVLFDLPGVVERARPALLQAGLDGRCRAVEGDFLKDIPLKADALMMRHILHDWDDEVSVDILKRCREALNPGGKIVVIDSVIPHGNQFYFSKWLDLMMLLIGGRERTEDDFRRVFKAAGFALDRIVPTALEVSIIEASSEG